MIEHPSPQLPEIALQMGRWGVDLFFVISGFIITEVAGTSRFKPGEFAVHRFFRVAPLYWLATLFVAATSLLFPAIFKTTVFNAEFLIKNLLFIPSPDPSNPTSWSPLFKLGWTLNYEMFFYLVCMSLFWCGTALRRSLLLSLIFGALIVVFVTTTPQGSVLDFYASPKLLPFLAGVWICQLRRFGVWERASIRSLWLLGIAQITATAAFFAAPSLDPHSLGAQIVMTASSSSLLALGLAMESKKIWRDFRLLEMIGDDSYSLYLTHMFLVGAAAAVLKKLGLSPFAFWAGMFLTFPVCLVVAHWCHQHLELPLVSLGKRLTSGRDKSRACGLSDDKAR